MTLQQDVGGSGWAASIVATLRWKGNNCRWARNDGRLDALGRIDRHGVAGRNLAQRFHSAGRSDGDHFLHSRARAIAFGPLNDAVVAGTRGFAASFDHRLRRRSAQRRTSDGEREWKRKLPLLPLVSNANQNARVTRIDIGNEPVDVPQGEVEVWRDAKGVMRAAVDRQERFPLFGRSGEHPRP